MPSRPRLASDLRRLVTAAMALERRTMQLYCAFESQFSATGDLRAFWFEMAQHESRHFGALALVVSLLDSASSRHLAVTRGLTRSRVDHLRRLLSRRLAEARRGISVERAFAIALEVEGCEVDDVVLDLLEALKGEAERERAVQVLIHDLGDLSYMIEKHTSDHALLARADALLERQVGRLRGGPAPPRRLRAVKR